MNVDIWRKVENEYEMRKNYTSHCMIDICDDLIAGMMLSQILYWFTPNESGQSKIRIHKEGTEWLAKHYDDWYDEIRITVRQAKRGLGILKEKGFVIVKTMKFSGIPTIHIRPDEEKINEAVQNWKNELYEKMSSETDKKDIPKSTKRTNGKVQNVLMESDKKCFSITEYTNRVNIAENTNIINKSYINPTSANVENVNAIAENQNNTPFNIWDCTYEELFDHFQKRIYSITNDNSVSNEISEYLCYFFDKYYEYTGVKHNNIPNDNLQSVITFFREHEYGEYEHNTFDRYVDRYFDDYSRESGFLFVDPTIYLFMNDNFQDVLMRRIE